MAEGEGDGGGGNYGYLAAAGISALSTMGGRSHAANWLNRRNQDRQYRYNRALRRTAVKDRMVDLANSGINPILAGKWDADSPGIGVSSSFDPRIGKAAVAGAVGNLTSTAIQGAQTEQNIEESQQRVSNLIVEAGLTTAQTSTEWRRSLLTLRQSMTEYFNQLYRNKEITKLETEIQLLEKELDIMETVAEQYDIEDGFDQTRMTIQKWREAIMGSSPSMRPR
jgi:hypothetical protein